MPERLLRAYVGTYRATTGALLTIAFADGALRLGAFELRATSESQFTAIGPPVDVTVAFAPLAGRATSSTQARMQVEDRPATVYDRIELVTPTASELSAYVGAFRSEELDVVWRFDVQDGALVATVPGAGPSRLRPRTRDEFTGPGMTLRFVRADGGAVTAATLERGRVRNLEFVKLPATR